MKEEACARERLHRPRGVPRQDHAQTHSGPRGSAKGGVAGAPQHTEPFPPCLLPSSCLARLCVRLVTGPFGLTRVPRPQDAPLPPGAGSEPHVDGRTPSQLSTWQPRRSPSVHSGLPCQEPSCAPNSTSIKSDPFPGRPTRRPLARGPGHIPLTGCPSHGAPRPRKPLSHSSQGQHLLPPGLSSNRLHAGGPTHRPFFLRRLGGEGQEAGPQRHYRCCPGQSTRPRFPCL